MPVVPLTGSLAPNSSLHALFRQVMTWSAGIACGIHLVVLIVMVGAGIYGLAWISAASVVFYALALFCLRRRYRVALCLYLMLAETLGHGILVSYWIGLGSGFYYYMLIAAPCLALADIRPPLLKWGLVKAVMAVLLVTVGWISQVGPAVRLSPELLLGLHLFNLACVVAIMTFVSQFYYQLATQAQRRLGHMAATDPLTGLLNRRSLLDNWVLARHAAGHELDGFGVAICDIDHFKTVNDRFGHETGDIVLCAVAERLSDGVRASDYVARWGGEEFLILLPSADLDATIRVAEALRYTIGNQPVVAAGHAISVTLTFGVAYDDVDNSLDQAISRADAALYRGKHAGRNRVQHY